MKDFASLNLPKALLNSLEKMNFNTPTPIQAQSIPEALKGHDILGSAQTGTGKTGAFGVPLVAHLLNNQRGTALVMTPTRELAVQVMTALKQMLANSPQIKTAVLIGGEPMPKQFNQLKMRPRLIVGTPGRINDHLARGTVQLNEANFLVLDETDRMLDMGFGVQIDKVLKFMPQKRQTLMFSATLPPYIIKMSNQYMNNPVRVSAGDVSTPVLKIEQEMIKVQQGDKYAKLTEELEKRSGSVIVFVKSKHGADKLAYRLSKDEHEAEAIHGDLRQNKRDKVIKQFRDGKYRILVATDIAARGLDIPHIEHVINFDLPQVADDYIHRIGRTGRNGAEGKAMNFVSSEDGAKWKAIQRLINPGEQGQYEGDGQPQRGGKSGGGQRSRSAQPGQKSPYAKKRPFGSRADGSGGGFRQNREGGREDRPQRTDRFREDRPQRSVGRNEAFRNSDFRDAPRSEYRGDRKEGRFENRSSENRGNRFDAPRQDRDGNREGANRGRFEGPRSEFRSDRPARSDRPRFEGNRSDASRGDRPSRGRDGNGERKRHEGGRNGNGGQSRNASEGYRSKRSEPRNGGDKPRFAPRRAA